MSKSDASLESKPSRVGLLLGSVKQGGDSAVALTSCSGEVAPFNLCLELDLWPCCLSLVLPGRGRFRRGFLPLRVQAETGRGDLPVRFFPAGLSAGERLLRALLEGDLARAETIVFLVLPVTLLPTLGRPPDLVWVLLGLDFCFLSNIFFLELLVVALLLTLVKVRVELFGSIEGSVELTTGNGSRVASKG